MPSSPTDSMIPERPLFATPRRRWILGLLLAAVLPVSAGCGIVPWLAHGVAGGSKRVKVKAEYADLQHQRVVVLVAADRRTLYRAPQSREKVCRAISSYIAEHVPTATLTAPSQALAFQQDNPYWTSMRPSRLIEELNVDRLIVIDLTNYRLHEPGNRHVAKGMITANIAVHADDAQDPDNASYYRTVTTRYPEDSMFGVVNGDEETIEMGMIKSFSLSVSRLFHDHEITQ